MAFFPSAIVPDYVNLEALSDYGLKINESEVGTETRRFTEDIGFKTKIRVRFSGMTADEVAILVAFYQGVKGTFGAFQLPTNFFLHGNTYVTELGLSTGSDLWRFDAPIQVETILEDIYSVEFVLVSLKDEEPINIDILYGFLRPLKLNLRLEGRVKTTSESEQEFNPPPALTWTTSTLDFSEAKIVTASSLISSPTRIIIRTYRNIDPARLTPILGDISDSGEYTEMSAIAMTFANIDAIGIVPDVRESATATFNSYVPIITNILPHTATPSGPANLTHFTSTTSVLFPENQAATQVNLAFGHASNYGTALITPVPLEPDDEMFFSVPPSVPVEVPPTPTNAHYTLTWTANDASVFIVPQRVVQAPSLAYGHAANYGTSETITYPYLPASLSLSVSDVDQQPVDQRSANSSNINFTANQGTVETLDVRFVTHSITLTPSTITPTPPFEQEFIVPNINFTANQGVVGVVDERFVTHNLSLTPSTITPTPPFEQEFDIALLTYGTLTWSEVTIDSYIPPSPNLTFSLDVSYNEPHDQPILGEAQLTWSTPTADSLSLASIDNPSLTITPSTPTLLLDEEATISPITVSFGQHFVGFVVHSSGLGYSIQKRSANFTAFNLGLFLVDTSSGPITMTLPAGIDGDIIGVADCSGGILTTAPTGFGNSPLTIVPSVGNTIQGENSLVLSQDNQAIQLVFSDNRWSIFVNAF